MKILVAEDDFTTRKIIQKFLSSLGECEIAVNGNEAVAAFRSALDAGEPYDLICLDIMMPGMDGQETLKEIRKIEEHSGIHGLNGVKIIMTTALDDKKNIMGAFKSQCDGYITKPLEKQKLVQTIESLGLSAV